MIYIQKLLFFMLGLACTKALRFQSLRQQRSAMDGETTGCCLLNCLVWQPPAITFENRTCATSKNERKRKLYTDINNQKNKVFHWTVQDWLKFIGDQEKGAKFFFQVGSFGGPGLAGDLDIVYPLLKKSETSHDWRGLIAEASPVNFEKLKKSYSDELSSGKVEAVHTAVKDACKQDKVSFVQPVPTYWENHKFFTDANGENRSLEFVVGIGTTTDTDSGQKLLQQSSEQYKTIEVPCTTTDVVMKRMSHNADFVQVDAEQSDGPILMKIDFNKSKPKLIRWENSDFIDKETLFTKLWNEGYYTIAAQPDMFGNPLAVRMDVVEAAMKENPLQ